MVDMTGQVSCPNASYQISWMPQGVEQGDDHHVRLRKRDTSFTVVGMDHDEGPHEIQHRNFMAPPPNAMSHPSIREFDGGLYEESMPFLEV